MEFFGTMGLKIDDSQTVRDFYDWKLFYVSRLWYKKRTKNCHFKSDTLGTPCFLGTFLVSQPYFLL